MPKLPKGFGRRKSVANALEELEPATVAVPSFRVFERPREPNKSFDGGMTFARTQTAPIPPRKNTPTKSREDNMFEDLKVNRGSGASNTNTASTNDNSSRLSAASTAPSSTSHHSNSNDWRSPHDKSNPSHAAVSYTPKSQSQPAGFLKSTSRSWSFAVGKGKSTSSPSQSTDENASAATLEDSSLIRPRAVTASSYASTTTPPKLEEQISLGGDFADMFSGFSSRKSVVMDMEANRVVSSSPDYLQAGPTVPARSYVPARPNHPSPLNLDRTRVVEASPYSWGSQRSDDGLMANSSPLYPPPVPHHGSPQPSDFSNNASPSTRAARPVPSADRSKRASGLAVRQPSTRDRDEVEDEDAKFLKESANMIQRLTEDVTPARARESWLIPSATPSTDNSFEDKPSGVTGWRRDTPPTPVTIRKKPNTSGVSGEDNMFAQASTSNAMTQRSMLNGAASQQINGPTNKVMTPAQFERYRQDQDRRASSGILLKDGDNDEDAYEEDDEDEAEKQKQIAKQRRKQEAHMAVYRQQMMKVTGEAPAPVARPSMSFSQSSPNLGRLGSTTPEDEEEDEEIPLAILAAHGFPNKNRHPVQLPSMQSNPNLRASSQTSAYPPASAAGGSVAGGRLPVFARNLPQDPYFAAGLVNQSNRESLAFGTGAGSMHGSGPVGPPGGLVGVIATEERSRAMRRGSPNPAGGYGPPAPPSNGFNGMGMPNMPQSMMSNLNGTSPLPMLTPGDYAQFEIQQQMQQMQQFMQLQMQFMNMMTAGHGSQGRPQSQNGNTPLSNRASTLDPGLQSGLSHPRAMSMMDANAAPWQQQSVQRNTMFAPPFHVPGNQYASSIAPSERSNVGLPGRYRPVSQYPGNDNRSRTASMSGALQDWSDGKHSSGTVKPIRKSGRVSDEDDEEGWAAMQQKREKKKSKWRSKKNESGLNDLVGYAA